MESAFAGLADGLEGVQPVKVQVETRSLRDEKLRLPLGETYTHPTRFVWLGPLARTGPKPSRLRPDLPMSAALIDPRASTH
jgi:hypothetical protein